MDDDQVEAPLVANFNGNPRIQWTQVLHERFVMAVNELGGPYVAKPKAIKETMGAHGLTLRHIKSHLQKYRAIFAGDRSASDTKNEEKKEDGNNEPLPNTEVVDDAMGDLEVYDVSQVQTGTEGIFSMTPAPYDIGGHDFQHVSEVQNGTEEIPSQAPAPYVIGDQDVYCLSGVPIGTEESPYLMPAYNIRSNEFYDISGVQIGTDDIQGADKKYTDNFTDGRCTNNTGKQVEASASVMDLRNDTLWSPDWGPTPYDMGDQEFCGEPTTLLGIEGGVNTLLEEPQNYTGILDIGNNNKGKGTIGVHTENVVANQFECPTDNMPLSQMLTIPYGMRGNEFYDGSHLQRAIGRGVQEAREVPQNYTGSPDISSNNKEKGIMGVHPQEVFVHQFECPTDNMPLCHTSPAPYGICGHEFYDGSSMQRTIERVVQQAKETYVSSLDITSDYKGKGTTGVHPDDVVAHQFEFPTNNMPLYHMLPTPYGMGGHEFYGGSSLQRTIEGGVHQATEDYTSSLDISSNNKGKGITGVHTEDVVAHQFRCPADNMPLYHMLPTPYGIGGHEFYDGMSLQRATERGVQQATMEPQNYTCSSNKEGNGTIGVHPEDVVAHHLEYPTNHMPMCHMLPAPYGIGGYESHDGSSVQRGIEGGVQQASEVDKMIQDDANSKYMKSLMKQAYQLFTSD